MKTRALTTSEANQKLMEMGFQRWGYTNRISDNDMTLPFGKTTKDVYYGVHVGEYPDGKSYLNLYRFEEKYWQGRSCGASGHSIFNYAKATAAEKKHFMELMEKEARNK